MFSAYLHFHHLKHDFVFQVLYFVKWSSVSAFIILIPQIAIDSEKYGRLVSAPFNIVKYNVFTSHGPDLYGTEPWTFYLSNGFLNFNCAFLLALAVIPVSLFAQIFLPHQKNNSDYVPCWLAHSALHLWLLVFGFQSHKEERFLFPVYPLLCFAAASTLDNIQKVYHWMFFRQNVGHYLDQTKWIGGCILILFSIISTSRIIALYQNYYAPMSVWSHVAQLPQNDDNYTTNNEIFVCVGKEWHRYPSSFFLPDNNWNLMYLESEFKGKKYYKNNSVCSSYKFKFGDAT